MRPGRAKLRPPSLPRDYVERPRLIAELDGAFNRRLTTVVAGPGFGKSTVLASWASTRGAAWYTVDRADASLGRFASGLSAALGLESVPGLEGDSADERRRAEPLAALVCEAIERAGDEDLALVIDDLHELSTRGGSVKFVEALCRQAPPRLHLVIASRREPPFPIARLRGRGDVLDFDATDLALSVGEVARILAAAGDVPTSIAQRVHEVTGGWSVAVRLIAERLRRSSCETNDELLLPTRPGGELFDYLAEEVFSRERPQVRDLVRRMAPLPRFSPEICAALGVEVSRQKLSDLVGRGLLLQEDGPEGWFSLHSLVRDFALGMWPLDPREVREVQRGAARWLESERHLEDALHLLEAAADHVETARLLVDRGWELLACGAGESVVRAFDGLPPAERPRELHIVAGQAFHARGDARHALECFHAAAGDDDDLDPGLAWRMGVVHYLRDDLDPALATFERGRLDSVALADEALLLAWTASVYYRRGDYATCRSFTTRALEAAEQCGEPGPLAAAHTIAAALAEEEGEEAELDRHEAAALEAAEEARDLLALVRIRMNRSTHHHYRGRYNEALEELDIGLRLAEVGGFGHFQARGLVNRGGTKFQLGLLEDAIQDLEAAKSLLEQTGGERISLPLMVLGFAYMERGDLTRARASFEGARAAAERAGATQVHAISLAGLARLLVREEPDEAKTLAGAALANARGASYMEVAVSTGWALLACSEPAVAESQARSTAKIARERNYQAPLAEALVLLAFTTSEPAREVAKLEQAAAISRELRNRLAVAKTEYALARLANPPDTRAVARAKGRLRDLGVRDTAAGAAGLLMALGPERPPPLEIQALGGFRVLRNGVAVPGREWRSKKARDLLKLLVARRGRPVTRDALIEELWPNEDPSKTQNRLSVALSTVRAVLDPERARPPEQFLRSSKDAVAIELDHIVVDIEGFHAEADAGLAAAHAGRLDEARELLTAAEASYAGDFLEENLYDDWTLALREELRATYVASTSTLADIVDDPRSAARYLLRVLERDRYDEGAHLALIASLLQARAHGEARRAYRAYAARMEEIDVEPQPLSAVLRLV